MYRYISRSFRFVVLLALVGALTGVFLKYSDTASSQRVVKPLPVVTQKTAPAPVVQTRPTLSKILAPLADGDLDTTFGTGQATIPAGVARTDVGGAVGDGDEVKRIGIQSDGKIIAGGTTSVGGFSRTALVRYKTDGTLDTTFGTGGKVIIPRFFGTAGSDSIVDMAVSTFAGSLDKIVVIENPSNPPAVCTNGNFTDGSMVVAVYKADGSSPDTSFGTGGFKAFPFFGCNTFPEAVTIQPSNGFILFSLETLDPGPPQHNYTVVARIDTTGAVDPSFAGPGGVAGQARTEGTGNAFTVQDMAVVPGGPNAGKIIISGRANGPNPNFIMNQYLSTGALDTTFGGGSGTAGTGFPSGNSKATSIAFYPDGRIVLGGDVNDGTDFGVARFSSAGVIDGTFGAGGRVTTDVSNIAGGNSPDGAKFVGVLSSGKIIATGNATFNAPGNNHIQAIGIVRYTTTGALDPGFGSGGVKVDHLGSNGANLNLANGDLAGALQSDGKILVGGQVTTSGQSDGDFYVARFNDFFLTAAGVSVSGRVTTSDGQGLRNAAVVLTDSHGVSRTVLTGAFGTYQFDDVQTGDTYIIGVASKHYRFGSRVLQVFDTVSGEDFVGDE